MPILALLISLCLTFFENDNPISTPLDGTPPGSCDMPGYVILDDEKP